ncbi:MAG: hypothetical protein HFI38_06115 [Lachnospiraceae bacterium]|jgi:tocopherol cyclase|nr:hypothetical protein [Lachnospiraceae bacterium]
MNRYFHGTGAVRSYFEGWYFKHQSPEHTLILIPAFHAGKKGQKSASLQILLDEASYHLSFDGADFKASADRLHICLGQNVFCEKGCRIHVDAPGLTLRGHLYYGAFCPPRRSFMGPLSHMPLPCFHEVLSLFHSLRGRLLVNGQVWDFNDGCGYLEKDWGTSFPGSYLWLQGAHKKTPEHRTSLMLAVAGLGNDRQPVTACSSLLLHEGRQYRLSTYQGGRLLRFEGRRIALKQGPYLLQVILPPQASSSLRDPNPASASPGSSLLAPQDGQLRRPIREIPRCPLLCQLYKGGKRLLDTEIEAGSLERV